MRYKGLFNKEINMAWVELLFKNTILDSIELWRSIQSFSKVEFGIK